DNQGCSDSQKDADGDGVTDDLDQCADTPQGETVDSEGCSDSQKDTDGDGVTDDLDQCADTPQGETVDNEGCSDSQKDTDGDGVTDDIDLCPGTQSGETVDSNGCSAAQIDSAPSAVIFDQAPAPNETDVNTPVSISWLASTDAEGDAITYDVYLGTNSGNLDLVSPNQTSLSFTSTELELGTTYHFRVDAKSTTFVTSSEVRSGESSVTGSFTDNRDSHVYGTIKIGSQVWMTENLVFNSTGSYSYDDNASNDADYGRLYEWAFVQAAIPTGWHLPTDDEWKTLETELGMPASDLNITGESTPRGTDQGTQMKSGGSSGLNFPLAGYRDGSSYFSININTYLWVNTDEGGGNIFRRKINISSPSCFRFTNSADTFAISVRLVRNQ
ncbi:MAG: FISUMP domain-containing protein, partial [Arenibacter sp.]